MSPGYGGRRLVISDRVKSVWPCSCMCRAAGVCALMAELWSTGQPSVGLRPCRLHQDPCPWPCTCLGSFKGLPGCDLQAPVVLAVGRMEKLLLQCSPGVCPPCTEAWGFAGEISCGNQLTPPLEKMSTETKRAFYLVSVPADFVCEPSKHLPSTVIGVGTYTTAVCQPGLVLLLAAWL